MSNQLRRQGNLQADLEFVVGELEGIAHFSPGRAGVIARDALVKLGVWSENVERDMRPHPVERWLLAGCPFPTHDYPGNREAVKDALLAGRYEFRIGHGDAS